MSSDGSYNRSRKSASFIEVMRFVWSYWRKMPVRFAFMVFATMSCVFLEVLIPQLSANLVIVIQKSMSGQLPGEDAWWAAAAFVLLFALVAGLKYVYMIHWVQMAARIMKQLMADGFRHVQRFSVDWHNNHFAGATQRKITRGMRAYDTLADALVLDLGPAFVLLVGLTLSMTARDAVLGLYFGLAAVVFTSISVMLSLRWVAPANVRANEEDSLVSGALADAISNNAVVKAFGAEAREDDRFEGVAERWRSKSGRAWSLSMHSSGIQSMLLVLLLMGLMTVVLARSDGSAERAEGAVYVITAYLVVHGYLRSVGGQVRRAQRAVDELSDLMAFIVMVPQVRDRAAASSFRPREGRVTYDRVRFGYRNQPRPIFDGLSVEIEPGEKVALVGASGSGKSTFAKLLQRLYDVTDGRVAVDGQDVRGVTQASLRRAIAVVPQEPILFHRSLAENIRYGRPGASDVQVVAAAERAHAHRFITQLADGYGTLVGERGVKLSGGERQRVAIARAILADAPILVLDEATSSLDSVTEHLIQDALKALMAERTSVVIAHRLSTIREVDRILVFDAGRIVEQGSHTDLMSRQRGRYRALVEMQAFGMQAPAAHPALEMA